MNQKKTEKKEPYYTKDSEKKINKWLEQHPLPTWDKEDWSERENENTDI